MSHLAFARRQFGLAAPTSPPFAALLALPSPGRIAAVVGASGAGKTRALNALAAYTAARVCRPLTPQQLSRPVLSLFAAHLPSADVLRMLACCGLADATLWTRPARTLSAGEQRRLELALTIGGRLLGDSGLASGAETIVIDEFDAHLDAETARCLAASLARIATTQHLRVIVSTHRPECLGALRAERVFEIAQGAARELPAPAPQDPLEALEIQRGSLADYAALARWHYLGAKRPGPVSDAFVAKLRGRIIAVATFGPSHLFLSPRNQVLPQFSSRAVSSGGARTLNANVRLLQRVIVEPRFRALGVASRLLAAALPQLEMPYVECLAEMGEFSGFLERAGFERRGRCKPSREGARLIRTLERLGLHATSLIEPHRRKRVMARLCHKDRERLNRQLKGLCRSRIETGVGRLRGSRDAPEELLQRALLRLHCQPEYFLWSHNEAQ